MSRATKPVPMCVLTIGYRDYVLPADEGMKIVKAMQSAFECEKHYENHQAYYEVGEQPNVEYMGIKPNQLRMPKAEVKPAKGAPPLLGDSARLLK